MHIGMKTHLYLKLNKGGTKSQFGTPGIKFLKEGEGKLNVFTEF